MLGLNGPNINGHETGRGSNSQAPTLATPVFSELAKGYLRAWEREPVTERLKVCTEMPGKHSLER